MLLKPVLFLSRLLLYVERLWRAFLPLFLLVAGVIVSTGLGLWVPLPLVAHIAGLVAVVVGCAVLLARGVRHLPGYPDVAEVRRAIERQKGLLHRPLSLLDDRPAQALSPAQEALWRKALHQAKGRAVLLPRWPETAFHKADLWGVRYPLMLGIVVLLASDHAPVRMGEALFPVAKISGTGRVLGVDVWIDPPAYTQRPGFALAKGETATVLAGATLRTQVHVRRPLLVDPVLQTTDTLPLPAVSGGYTASTTLTVDTPVRIGYGWTRLFDAQVRVTPDTAPMIAFVNELARTAEGLLDVRFEAVDDYGVQAIWFVAEHPSESVSRSLIVPARNRTELSDRAYVDLTAEIIAGQPARVFLEVMDVAGQTGRSEVFTVTLPERPFHHPVAQKLVALRKELVADATVAARVMAELDLLLAAPEAYGGDTRAYMSLTLARQIVYYRDDDKANFVRRTAGLLWDAAIRIEKGPVSQLLEEAMQRQKELQEALAQGADPEKLRELFARFQQAMADLFQNMTFNGGEAQMNPDVPGLRDEDVARLMQRIAELMASGAYEEARKALKQLEDLMANLQFANDPQAAKVMEMLKNMGSLAQQQKKLIDESFQNPVPGRLTLEQQIRQRQLMEQTNQLRRQLEEMGVPAGAIYRAMQAMQQVLENAGTPGNESFVHHLMNQAYQALEQARESMIQQLLQQSGYGSMSGMKRDPSGQLHHSTEDVKVPQEAPETLSRKIRDELFDRADDLGRSEQEQNYLRRLLERF
jgi:hypothetical protein